MTRLWQWLTGRDSSLFIAHWSHEREQYYTRQTYRYLGIRPEPVYPWSRKYRPKAKLSKVEQFGQKRSA